MYKFIDLFCGIGGFRVALEKQGMECVFSSDIDKQPRKDRIAYNILAMLSMIVFKNSL
jgi:site-specific DNA-cytosine methylase